MSWQRRILRIDLTSGTHAIEPLNMDWAFAYAGARGLAIREAPLRIATEDRAPQAFRRWR